jgi:prepilin peptidase CpaA
MTGELRDWLSYALVAPLPLGLLWAMATDLHRFEIPNRIPIILAGAFLFASLASGQDLLIILRQCGIAAAFLLLGLLLFSRGIVGGGDVKLLAACVPWLAPGQLLPFLFWMAVFGGFIGLLAIAIRRLPAPYGLADNAWLSRFKASDKIPYGLAIGCAGLITLPRIPLLAN